MNPPDPDNPILSRYILDELPPSERAQVERWMLENPTVQHEVHALGEVVESLRAQAPVHDLQLTARQRARVMQGPPRRMPPAQHMIRAPRSGVLSGLLRMAALITLLAGAFMLGRHFDPDSTLLTGTDVPPDSGAERLDPVDPVVATVAEDWAGASDTSRQSEPAQVAEAAASQREMPEDIEQAAPVSNMPAVLAEAPAGEKPVEMLVGGTTPIADRAGAAKAAIFGITMPASFGEVVSTARRSTDQAVLRPAHIRPAVASDARQLAAKPLAAGDGKAAAAAPARRKPDLHIHAWSYETASCPWSPRHRLLRVTIQLPADQEAVALGSHEYPVEVVFDPNHVREFRRLSTRYLAPEELRSAGTQTIWYEFVPNGAPASSFENGKRIATVRLPGAKFTTQAVGPFDASRLQVLDRGRDWKEARGEFQFETALVALALLLDGASAEGGLNQQVVLDLAQTAREAGDPDGSRARFINSLRQLGRLAGR